MRASSKCSYVHSSQYYSNHRRHGEFGQDIFTLRGTYFQGRCPKSVNMHWRRFATKDIPFSDPKEFEQWLLQRWREKDDLLEYFMQHGRFPADDGTSAAINGAKPIRGAGYIETEVRPKSVLELLQVLVPPLTLALLYNVFLKYYRMSLRALRLA